MVEFFNYKNVHSFLIEVYLPLNDRGRRLFNHEAVSLHISSHDEDLYTVYFPGGGATIVDKKDTIKILKEVSCFDQKFIRFRIRFIRGVDVHRLLGKIFGSDIYSQMAVTDSKCYIISANENTLKLLHMDRRESTFKFKSDLDLIRLKSVFLRTFLKFKQSSKSGLIEVEL